MPAEPLLGTVDGFWTVTLPPELTVIELAAIMGGIGVRTTAHFLDRGYIQLRPVDAGAPCPTGFQLRDILQHGLPKLPVLISRPEYIRST